jgi:hypothetical protein
VEKEEVVIYCDEESILERETGLNLPRLWWLKTQSFEFSLVVENHHVSSICAHEEVGRLLIPGVTHEMIRPLTGLNWIDLSMSSDKGESLTTLSALFFSLLDVLEGVAGSSQDDGIIIHFEGVPRELE